MGFKYKKSINIGGGIKINAGKKGIGVSAGVKGLRVSHGADGKTRVTASIPGTGLSYQETLNKKSTLSTSNSKNIKYEEEHGDAEPIFKFTAIHRGHYDDDGKLDSTYSHLMNKKCEVIIVEDAIHIETDSDGRAKVHYPAEHIAALKEERKSGLWIFKSTEVVLKITLDRDRFGMETMFFKLEDEQAIDDVIDSLHQWQMSIEENRSISDSFVLEDNDAIYSENDDEDPFENDPEFQEFLLEEKLKEEASSRNAAVYEISDFSVFDVKRTALIVKVLKGEINVGDGVMLVGRHEGQEIMIDVTVTDIVQNNAFVDFVDSDDDVVAILVEKQIDELELLVASIDECMGCYIRDQLILRR